MSEFKQSALIAELIDEFKKFPGIGEKSASRIAFFIAQNKKYDPSRLSKILGQIKTKIHFCKICFNITDKEICDICLSPTRKKDIICVVQDPKDVYAIEKTGAFDGVYHVLCGCIDPLNGIGPNDIYIKELVQRLGGGDISELILATETNIEGEATASYISRILKDFGIKITRLSSGLSIGTDIEYADELTLLRSFENRHIML